MGGKTASAKADILIAAVIFLSTSRVPSLAICITMGSFRFPSA